MNAKKLVSFGILTLALFAFAGSALAHDVAVWAEVVKGRIHVEAWFSDGTPVGDAPVEVSNADGKILLAGQTSPKGVFDFTPPAKVDLTIKVLVGGGHDSTARIPAKDLE